VKGVNHYYCNKQEYDEIQRKKQSKDNTFLCINDIFGYKVTSTVLFKEINGLHDTYTYEKIFAYLQDNQQYLQQVMEKDFASEYAKIRYFSAILKNNLVDFKIKEPEFIRTMDVDMPSNRYKRKKQRKALSEIETEVGEDCS
jgi:hypothetical protein